MADSAESKRSHAARIALRFVLMIGVVSFFADFVYEGGRSIAGSFLATLGASGAIFGLFGALFAIGFKLGKPGMDLVRSNIGILVINLIITFTVPAISWQAHVAGLVAGFILTFAIYYPPRRVAPVVPMGPAVRRKPRSYRS